MCVGLLTAIPVFAEDVLEVTPGENMGAVNNWYANENFDDRTADEKGKLTADSEDALSAYGALSNGYLKDDEADRGQYVQLEGYNDQKQSIKELTGENIKAEKNLTFSFKFRNNQTSYANTVFYINDTEIFQIYHDADGGNSQKSIRLMMKDDSNTKTYLKDSGVNMGTSAAWHDFSFEMERVAAETEEGTDYVKITAFVDGMQIGGEYKYSKNNIGWWDRGLKLQSIYTTPLKYGTVDIDDIMLYGTKEFGYETEPQVNKDAKTFTFNFNRTIDKGSVANVVVKRDKTVLAKGTDYTYAVSADKKVVTYTLNDEIDETQYGYIFDISALKSVYSNVFKKGPYVYGITVCEYTDLAVTQDSASVNVVNLGNNRATSAVLVYAAYDANGKALAIKGCYISVAENEEKGTTTYNTDSVSVADAVSYRAFLLDSLNDMNQIIDSVELSISE